VKSPVIISLLTDFGTIDAYVGVMKGVIYGINPQAGIVDLSHEIEPQCVMEAALMLNSAYRYFPRGTIHLTVVDPGVGTERRAICLLADGHFFVAPDNGLVTLVYKGARSRRVVEITNSDYFLKPVSSTFHGRDIFAPVAAYLSKGVKPEEFGRKIKTIELIDIPGPRLISGKRLIGQVIHVDRFGNLITDIPVARLINLTGFKQQHVRIKIKSRTIYGISTTYSQRERGELLAIFGSSGFLEISANLSNAQKILVASLNDPVEVVIG
jgi:S-adenosylmethionine hydrolase